MIPSDAALAAEPGHSNRARWVLFAVSAAVVTLPFLFVTFPPATDLPQHVAQVRLFADAWNHPEGAYRIQWFTPYVGIVALFGIIWQFVGPLATGRVGLVVLGLMWVAAVHWLAAKRRRPPEAAVLASMLYLGCSLYWGFCNFLLGWPFFLVWFERTTRPASSFRRRDSVVLFGLALMLYECHALWLAVALGWLAVSFVTMRLPWRVILWRAGAAVPITLIAGFWWLTLSLGKFGYERDWIWQQTPLSRVTSWWVASSIFYGPRGPTLIWTFVALMLWLALALWRSRRGFLGACDRQLLLAGGLMLLGALLLPNNISFTMGVAERFVGPGVALLLLALPTPRLGARVDRLFAVGVLVAYGLATTLIWQLFDQQDLAGLSEAIEAVPAGERVLGLDYIHVSEEIAGIPFMHLSAYAQVAKEERLAFTFAEMPPMLVVLKHPEKRWTPHVEWYTERITASDFAYFDYAIVGLIDSQRDAALQVLPLTPVTSAGRWRLYKIRHGAGDGRAGR